MWTSTRANGKFPQENSKTGQPHIVYMSRQVVALFRERKALAGDSEWVLPSRSSLARPLAKNALNQALDGMNFPIDPFTIHDLRRTGSTRLHEQGFSSDVVEKALNHTIGGVRGVYNRAEYAENNQNWRINRIYDPSAIDGKPQWNPNFPEPDLNEAVKRQTLRVSSCQQ